MTNSEYQDQGGYVYVLTNEAMPGIVKIGRSSRGGRLRANELYKSVTGVPVPFKMEFEIYSDDPASVEIEVHECLQQNRVNESREFFRVPVVVAVQEVCQAAIQNWALYVSNESNYFDSGEAAWATRSTGLSWNDVVCAFYAMSADDILSSHRLRLESKFNSCRHIYGDDSDLTRAAESKLTDFLERFSDTQSL